MVGAFNHPISSTRSWCGGGLAGCRGWDGGKDNLCFSGGHKQALRMLFFSIDPFAGGLSVIKDMQVLVITPGMFLHYWAGKVQP